MSREIASLGGGGVRTPLVAFGINESANHLDAEELVLYDVSLERAEMTARLSRGVIRRDGGACVCASPPRRQRRLTVPASS